jgi:hypothetical protein
MTVEVIEDTDDGTGDAVTAAVRMAEPNDTNVDAAVLDCVGFDDAELDGGWTPASGHHAWSQAGTEQQPLKPLF